MVMATVEQPPVAQAEAHRIRIRVSRFVVIVQAILLLVHWFVYETWVFLRPATDTLALRIAVLLLSVSFVAASLLAYRYWNVWVRVFYRFAAVWLSFLNFLFLAACVSWPLYLATRAFALPITRGSIANDTFGLAAIATLCGLLNARWLRVTRISVKLPNLPTSWRGRVAAVISDVHLGHVNGASYLRRVVTKLRQLRPDVVFIPGDLFDGSHADVEALASPLKQLKPPLGTYFVTGNHEEFSDHSKYLHAVSQSGVRVLNNERITLDHLQIVGVHDRESAHPEVFSAILDSANIDRSRASILLTHVPRHLQIPENAGISLQLSGHTHGGQVFPFTWFTHRIFRDFTHGLNRFANLLVYTSYGIGTWGPPLRLGTFPEIVLIHFN
jgi:uncharacterized protein